MKTDPDCDRRKPAKISKTPFLDIALRNILINCFKVFYAYL
jgi:hypothetical protein